MKFIIGDIKLVLGSLFFRRPGEDRPWERGRLARQTLKEMLRNYFYGFN